MKRRLGVTLGAATIIGAAGIGVGLLLAGGHTATPGHGSTHVITVDQPIAAITSPATPSTPTVNVIPSAARPAADPTEAAAVTKEAPAQKATEAPSTGWGPSDVHVTAPELVNGGGPTPLLLPAAPTTDVASPAN